MAPSVVGLPTPIDEDIVIALIQLSKEQDNFASDTVYFTPAQLFAIIRWTNAGKNLARLEESLIRLRALTITYERVWFDVEKHEVDDKFVTGIIGEARLVRRRGKKSSTDHLSYFHWEPRFHKSLQAGNLTNLDLDLYFSLDRPSAKRLLRHLNKRFYGKRASETYERDMRHLACGHLGLTNNKDLKRNLLRSIGELELREYIAPLPANDRFRKIGPGHYRVVFDLHPSRLAKRMARKRFTPDVPQDESAMIVTTYHEHRFNRTNHQPKRFEVNAAAELISKYDAALILDVLAEAAEKTKASYKDDDVHFNAAIAFIERLADHHIERAEKHEERNAERAKQYAEEECQRAKKAERIKRRRALLLAWGEVKKAKRQEYVERAMRRSPGLADLIRERGIEEPLPVVLELFAVDQTASN